MRPEEAEEMDAMDEKIGSLQWRMASAQKERDDARDRVAKLETIVSELETVLEPIVCHLDADDEGKVHPDLIDAARAVLAKAKGGTS
jgi:hypothetical protein